MLAFQLHPRLAADCVEAGRLPLCQLLLMNDSNYPWFVLVPRRPGIREIFELSIQDQHLLLQESSLVSSCLMRVFQGHKMNIAALGNVVPQLHIHHIVRYPHDRSWPAPVWGRFPAQPYEPMALSGCLEKVRCALGEWLVTS
jgi:diadenosine tetraphosphate (Ap4A) HIT family hydrolase